MTVLQHLQKHIIEINQELEEIDFSLQVEMLKCVSDMRKEHLENRKAYLEILIDMLEDGMKEFGGIE